MIPASALCGQLPDPIDRINYTTNLGKPIEIETLGVPTTEVVNALTFGALGSILQINLPTASSRFWLNRVIRGLGFFTADLKHKRFFRQLEIIGHREEAAWDVRSVWARAYVDVRNLVAGELTRPKGGGASIDFYTQPPLFEALSRDTLAPFNTAICKLKELLATDSHETVFQDFFEHYPVVIDLYGRTYSLPKFEYPGGVGPTGKSDAGSIRWRVAD
jgi:hypothetical protein